MNLEGDKGIWHKKAHLSPFAPLFEIFPERNRENVTDIAWFPKSVTSPLDVHFLHFLMVSVTVVLGLRFASDFLTNSPVLASLTTFLTFFSAMNSLL